MTNTVEIEDLRQYVFGVFLGREEESVAKTDTLKFLGTAFCVTKSGDAITAAHIYLALQDR